MADSTELEITRHWQAGQTGCGQLVVGLKRQLEKLRAGETLKVTAFSAGAPADLPAWCRMTGHRLIHADHPVYIVQKRARPDSRT